MWATGRYGVLPDRRRPKDDTYPFRVAARCKSLDLYNSVIDGSIIFYGEALVAAGRGLPGDMIRRAADRERFWRWVEVLGPVSRRLI